MNLSLRVRTALVLGVIVLALAFIFTREGRAPGPQNIVAWSGSGTLYQPTGSDPTITYGTDTVGSFAPGTTLDTSRLAALDSTPRVDVQSDEFLSVLAQLINTPRPFASGSGENAAADAIRDAFAMVPQFNPQLPASPEISARSPEQESVFQYGNAAGSIIKNYEAAHADAVQVLATHSKDRGNTQKAASIRDLGEAISKVGLEMKKISNVPQEAVDLHAQFADGYILSGALLSKMADATTDEAYVASINAYNSSVMTLVEKHVALATYFSLAGVRFSAQDGGSVFSFGGF